MLFRSDGISLRPIIGAFAFVAVVAGIGHIDGAIDESIGIELLERKGDITGNNAASVFIIMLGSPILVDELLVPHGIHIIDNDYPHLIPVTINQEIPVSFHQENQVASDQFIGAVHIFRHDVENKVPAAF